MKKLVILLVVVAALVAGRKFLGEGSPIGATGPVTMVNAYPPGSPLYQQHQHFVDRFNAEPALRERFAGIATSEGLYGELTTALSRGARSVSEQRLLGMVKAMSAVIPRLPEKSCAKLMVPRRDFDPALGADLRAALEKLPPAQHRRVTDFYIDALLAEVNDAPLVSVDKESLDNALYELAYMYQADAGRLKRVLQSPGGASQEDLCWGANSLALGMAELAEPNAVALARSVWGGGN